MYKGLFRLGILTIILSFLIVPGSLSTRCSTSWSMLDYPNCAYLNVISYDYTIEKPAGLSYDAADEKVTFTVHVNEITARHREWNQHEHHDGVCSSKHDHKNCFFADTIQSHLH